jgi:glycine/D-amino acid oxidase-like deaminating enzyme
MTGVSTAYWLHKYGVNKVTVLEYRGISSGATGRNGGHLWPGESVLPAHIEKYGMAEVIRPFNFSFETLHLVEEYLNENNLVEECEFHVTGNKRQGLLLIVKGAVVTALNEEEAKAFQKATTETNDFLKKIQDAHQMTSAEINK